MPGGLPVLAHVSVPTAGDRPWSLGRRDLEQLDGVRERLATARAVLVTGADGPAQAAAVGLAGAAAAAGTRTILVECDVGHPTLAAELGLAPAPGLHEYLRWEATPADVVQALALAGPASAGAAEPLAFVAAGRPAGDPATLLGLQSFRHMSAKLRHGYELVVLAGPPLDEQPAALTAIAAEADALLAGIGTEQARRSERRALRKRLRRLAPAPLGAVVAQRS
ncbi:MAG: hypothetical protein U0R71_07875 [Solirubrobacterales bacterium]